MQKDVRYECVKVANFSGSFKNLRNACVAATTLLLGRDLCGCRGGTCFLHPANDCLILAELPGPDDTSGTAIPSSP